MSSMAILLISAVLLVSILGVIAWCSRARRQPRVGIHAILFLKQEDPASAVMLGMFLAAQEKLRGRKNLFLYHLEYACNQELARDFGINESDLPTLGLQFKLLQSGVAYKSSMVAPPIKNLGHMLQLINAFVAYHSLGRR